MEKMAKYLVETYYTCSFKVSHYLDGINEAELSNLEKRNDGKGYCLACYLNCHLDQ